MARIQGVEVSRELWQDLTTKGWHTDPKYVLVCREGLPEGAELVNSYYDGQRRSVIFIFHHESFDNVPCTAGVPIADVQYGQVRLDAWAELNA